jgi:TPR repeat protein
MAVALIATNLCWASIGFAEKSEFNKAVSFVRDKDYSSAVNVFKSLAEQDDHDAQYNLALLLRKGLGHPSNYPLALQWAWLSQLSGKIKAAVLAEDLISLVPDETQDLVRAKVLKILQQRMEKGDRDAILQKAQYHLNVVVEPDYIAAYALRSLGAAIGLKGAIELRDEIEGELDIKDLMDSQARAAKIFVKYDWSAEDEG